MKNIQKTNLKVTIICNYKKNKFFLPAFIKSFLFHLSLKNFLQTLENIKNLFKQKNNKQQEKKEYVLLGPHPS